MLSAPVEHSHSRIVSDASFQSNSIIFVIILFVVNLHNIIKMNLYETCSERIFQYKIENLNWFPTLFLF